MNKVDFTEAEIIALRDFLSKLANIDIEYLKTIRNIDVNTDDLSKATYKLIRAE